VSKVTIDVIGFLSGWLMQLSLVPRPNPAHTRRRGLVSQVQILGLAPKAWSGQSDRRRAFITEAGPSLIALSLHRPDGWWMWKSSGDCEAEWERGDTETVQVMMWELLEGRLIEKGRGLRASRLLNHGGLSVSLREASSAHAYI